VSKPITRNNPNNHSGEYLSMYIGDAVRFKLTHSYSNGLTRSGDYALYVQANRPE